MFDCHNDDFQNVCHYWAKTGSDLKLVVKEAETNLRGNPLSF